MAKKKSQELITDINKQYIIELCVAGEDYITVPVVCNVTARDRVIIATAAEDPQLFQTHRYYDEFFQWLLYTGKIKVYNNNDMENNNAP